jgi:microcystin-dependent protein
MSDPFLGEIRMFGGNFAPLGWALCNGQLLPISQNSALFSLLGTTFGGNGQTTFGLPDLRGRVPVHAGQGPGLSSYNPGENGGVENVTLITTQMPAHNHTLNATNNDADNSHPQNNILAGASASIYTASAPTGPMSQQAIGLSGGGQPHQNLQPFLCINFIIALQGIYPSRN